MNPIIGDIPNSLFLGIIDLFGMNVLKLLWGIASCKATSHLENKNKEMASFGTSWSSCQEACIKWKHENRSLENQHATYPRVLWSMSVAYLVHGSSPRESEIRNAFARVSCSFSILRGITAASSCIHVNRVRPCQHVPHLRLVLSFLSYLR